MLPVAHRLRDSGQFSAVIRSGARARSGVLVVHQRPSARADRHEPIVGLIVSKAVGGSVVRHRVSRRLRAQLSSRLAALPAGSATVVRALPEAADATSALLGADLDRALRRLAGRR